MGKVTDERVLEAMSKRKVPGELQKEDESGWWGTGLRHPGLLTWGDGG